MNADIRGSTQMGLMESETASLCEGLPTPVRGRILCYTWHLGFPKQREVYGSSSWTSRRCAGRRKSHAGEVPLSVQPDNAPAIVAVGQSCCR